VFQGPPGDSYLGGNLFFDARPNPPGWVCNCEFPGERLDLPFQTVVGLPGRTSLESLAAAAQIRPGGDAFAVEAIFRLGPGSNGIDPLAEDVTIKVGAVSWTIVAGSFRHHGIGGFIFNGQIGSARLAALIKPLRDGRFGFVASAKGAALGEIENPVAIGIVIGDDAGTTEVIAKLVGLHHQDH
jgi:hypothetical protein